MDYGDPRLPDRFWDKVQVVAEASTYPGPCWVWTGAKRGRYGAVWVRDRSKMVATHRWIFEVRGVPLEDLVPDHLCRVVLCCNPAHLEPVTNYENFARGNAPGAKALRSGECKRGHRYTEDNTYVNPQGYRTCRKCHRVSRAAYNARLGEENV